MQTGIVIVGGGAGGLELACKLGRKLGRSQVALVDRRLYHVWKPSLHEVAAGTLDIHQEGLSYLMVAHDNDFEFVYGEMVGMDATARTIAIAAVHDADGGTIIPPRDLPFGSLVLSVGSTANHFGIPGAEAHTIALNDPDDAERFRLQMLKAMVLAEQRKGDEPGAGIDIVIIGAGATGVELAAELRQASSVHSSYGFRQLDADRDVRLTLLEGAPRILAPLSEKVSAAATRLLAERHVNVVTHCKVARISPGRVEDADGRVYPADLCVWAAGIKAPPFLAHLGLPVTRNGLLEVDDHLRVRDHPGIYALGDCAWCPGADGRPVPPRAQTAHQQAAYLTDDLLRRHRGQAPNPAPYVYRDHGSLVSLGTGTSVGSLMGSLFNASWFVEGLFARLMYQSLHLMHHQAVLGTLRAGVLAVARFLIKRTKPLVKLH